MFLIDRALVAIATTKNENGNDKQALNRIIQIYEDLKKLKQLKQINLNPKDVEDLLNEALQLKKFPFNQVKEKLNKLSNEIDLEQEKHIQLFCFPYAGGVANVYKNWIDYLPSSISVIPVEYPGRGSRAHEPLVSSLKELISILQADIFAQIKSPFAFFGHSLGAVIAYELSSILKKTSHLSPHCLFLSACPGLQKVLNFPSMRHLNEQEFIQKVKQLNGTPPELFLNAEFNNFFLPILQADFSLLDDYTPSEDPKYDIPLILYGGKDDQHVCLEDIQKWQSKTKGYCTLQSFTGDHFFIRQPKEMLEHVLNTIKDQILI